MRLGGSADVSEPFPEQPRGMHRRTYLRLRESGPKPFRRLYLGDRGLRYSPHTGSAVKARLVPISHSASARQRVSVSRCWPSDLTGTCEALRPANTTLDTFAGPADDARHH